MRFRLILTLCTIAGPALAEATIDPVAAYLPDRSMHLMPRLEAAIDLVAREHQGCRHIDNASYSESHSTPSAPTFFVSCAMSGRSYPFQNVYVRDGQIVDTQP